MYSVITKDMHDEVRGKHGVEAATALLCALEATIFIAPQSLAKILSVLEGSAVTEPAASKMRKELSKTYSPWRIATSTSSNPGRYIYKSG